MNKNKLSVVMPAYNNADISLNLKEAIKALEKVTKEYELILVDDGSPNKLFFEAKKIDCDRVKVVGYSKNQGKGHAIKYGCGFAKGDYVTFLDSGRDINPEQIKRFIEIMEKEEADIVIGSKKHKDSKLHYPAMRRFMSFVYQIVNRILFNLNVKDTQVGLKLFKGEVIKKIMPLIVVKRFAFDLELLVIATKYKYKIVEAPVTIKYKFSSTVNPKAVFWMLWDTAAIFYRDKILNQYSKERKK